jgi:hypothetical protein
VGSVETADDHAEGRECGAPVREFVVDEAVDINPHFSCLVHSARS